MNQIKIQPQTCYYITASNLAREFYDLNLDEAADAIESIVGAADLASAVEGEIGRAMVTPRQFIKIMSAECEPEIVDTIRSVINGLDMSEFYIDIYN